MTDAANVRRIEPSDWSALRALRLEALADAPYAFAQTTAEATVLSDQDWKENCERRADGDREATFVGVVDGQLVAMAAAFTDVGSPTVRRLVAVYSDPAHRGTGLAARVVNATIEWAHVSGATRVEAWVTTRNQRAARFYERLGFVVTDRTQPFPPDPTEHEVLMVLEELHD